MYSVMQILIYSCKVLYGDLLSPSCLTMMSVLAGLFLTKYISLYLKIQPSFLAVSLGRKPSLTQRMTAT